MAKLTFKKNLEEVTVKDCLQAHRLGLAVVMDEGRKITVEIEK